MASECRDVRLVDVVRYRVIIQLRERNIVQVKLLTKIIVSIQSLSVGRVKKDAVHS